MFLFEIQQKFGINVNKHQSIFLLNITQILINCPTTFNAVFENCSGSALLIIQSFPESSCCEEIVTKAQLEKARILFLPEATDYISRNANHSIELSQEVQSNFLSPLLDYVKSLNGSTYLSIGIHLPGKREFEMYMF